MRHLITGGSGFVGDLVARRLRERGEQVRILDIWEDPSRPRDIEYVACSVTNRDGVAAAMHGVDVVHHHAALVAQTDAGRNYWDVNVEGSRIVAEEAAKAGVRAFIHTSTTAVFGIPPDGPITNATPTRPVEPYGRSKLAGEHAVEAVCAQHAIPLITIRPRATLGGGRLGIFQVLFEWIRENRNVYVIGSGNIRFQFIHALDLMDFYMLALDAGRSGTYNVGTDEFGTLRGELEALIRHDGSTSRVRSLPEGLAINALRLLYWMRVSPLVPWHYLTYHKACYFDVQPLLAMGWKPRYSNEAMLRESYDWFCANEEQARRLGSASPHRAPLRQGLLRLVKRMS
ncbi:NAD-dependent epimerase/dehydratase family protein [Falsiroseomonas oryzae]|uniref:NAD-dependent epimerase/dehydratase family protein n=1 Tax=Falsiroseomonas oryzae TaxID=2766473 RepID=UPI0022EA5127|nr:NAD-dependent epimerase/dehydratase family protein [Roseomonas sp. MO-31]